MAEAINLNVLNNLPVFRGNSRPHEVDSFVASVDVKTFFRTLDNHFDQYNIVDDAQKLRILFQQIDKNSGNAIDLVNLYSGRPVPYNEVRQDFLNMYPNFSRHEFRQAARGIINTNINVPSIFCGMTKLESQSRALIESYLTKESLHNIGIFHDTHLAVAHDENGDVIETIPLADILQNMVMHMFIATQLSDAVYQKLTDISPNVPSTRFMSKVVTTTEKEKLLKKEYQKERKEGASPSNEVLYTIQNVQPTKNTGSQSNKKHEDTNKYNNTNTYANPPTFRGKRCYICNRTGHYARNCRQKPNCEYCRNSGHDVRMCHKRQKDRVSFCTNCSRLGHVARACRKPVKGRMNNYYRSSNQSKWTEGRNESKHRVHYMTQEESEYDNNSDTPDREFDDVETEENTE